MSQYLIAIGPKEKDIPKSEKIMINTIEPNLQNEDNKSRCPDCDSELGVPCDVKQGELLSCPGCGIELEVKKISNGGGCLELQEFIMEGEDWGE